MWLKSSAMLSTILATIAIGVAASVADKVNSTAHSSIKGHKHHTHKHNKTIHGVSTKTSVSSSHHLVPIGQQAPPVASFKNFPAITGGTACDRTKGETSTVWNGTVIRDSVKGRDSHAMIRPKFKADKQQESFSRISQMSLHDTMRDHARSNCPHISYDLVTSLLCKLLIPQDSTGLGSVLDGMGIQRERQAGHILSSFR